MKNAWLPSEYFWKTNDFKLNGLDEITHLVVLCLWNLMKLLRTVVSYQLLPKLPNSWCCQHSIKVPQLQQNFHQRCSTMWCTSEKMLLQLRHFSRIGGLFTNFLCSFQQWEMSCRLLVFIMMYKQCAHFSVIDFVLY